MLRLLFSPILTNAEVAMVMETRGGNGRQPDVELLTSAECEVEKFVAGNRDHRLRASDLFLQLTEEQQYATKEPTQKRFRACLGRLFEFLKSR